MLGRLGRSLGVHLLMASQRIEEGRMRGLDAHLSYRIALKTFSAADSRAVLDVDLAYRLPPEPGAGYLKTGAGEPMAFTAAYVSGPVPVAGTPAAEAAERPAAQEIRLFTGFAPRSGSAPGVPAPGLPTPGATTGVATEPPTTLIDLWAGRLEGHGGAARRIWLPPLGVAPVLDALARTAAASIRRLCVPVGIIDRPYDQRHDVLWADFTGSAGHALVVGGPRSGKSTLLTSLVLALALSHPPTDLHCYVVDAGGGTLTALTEVPQVGGVARRDEAQRVRRMVAQLTAELVAREVAGVGADRATPALFLVIDGWAAFRAAFDDLEPAVAALIHRGLAYGIHVILSASRWPEIRPAMKDLMGLRFELRLGDPAESEVDRRRAAEVPADAPGRGLTRDGFHLLVATPGPPDAPGSAARCVADRRRRWPGDGAPPVRLLPSLVTPEDLRRRTGDLGPCVVPLGLGESDLQVVAADFEAEPHLVVWGDSGSGRTSFLRTLAATIAARRDPGEARFLIVDHRRTLLGEAPAGHLAGYAGSAAATAGLVAEAVQLLTARLDDGTACPHPGTTVSGPAPSCSCSSTTTNWWPPAPGTRCRRCWSCSRTPGTSACT